MDLSIEYIEYNYIRRNPKKCKGIYSMTKNTSMDLLKVDTEGIVKRITNVGSMRRRLNDLGIIENTKITCVGESPLGDPRAYLIRGSIIALRNEDAKNIFLETENICNEKTILLVGNPNVGKSTVFNALTGIHQHTGNWIGKTVALQKVLFLSFIINTILSICQEHIRSMLVRQKR